MTITRYFYSSNGNRLWSAGRLKLAEKLGKASTRLQAILKGDEELKSTVGASDAAWAQEKLRIAMSRRLFENKVFPRGIQNEMDAKELASRLLPGERKLIFDALRKITVDQYEEHKRLGNAEVHWEDILRIWYIYYIPTTIFGFVDNVILIYLGEEIDSHFGVVLGISILAAAGVSNIFSNLIGIGLPRIVERWVKYFGLIRPILSAEQWNNKHVRFIINLAKVCGILTGCTLGLFPLLFMHPVTRSQILEGATFADPEKSVDDEGIEGLVDPATRKRLLAEAEFEKDVGHMQVRVRGQGSLYARALDDYAISGLPLHHADKSL